MKIKEEYLRLIEIETENIKRNMREPYKTNNLEVLRELKKRIKTFSDENVVLLSNFGKSIFKGGNCEVIGKHLFKNPYNKNIYPDGFFNCVGNSQTAIYILREMKGGISENGV